jgi:vancomycin resistance protein YoaR
MAVQYADRLHSSEKEESENIENGCEAIAGKLPLQTTPTWKVDMAVQYTDRLHGSEKEESENIENGCEAIAGKLPQPPPAYIPQSPHFRRHHR